MVSETAWARAKRLSAITYRTTPFQIVWFLIAAGFAAVSLVINEFAAKRSTAFHVEIFVIFVIFGVGMPFLFILLNRFARAPYEQRDEALDALGTSQIETKDAVVSLQSTLTAVRHELEMLKATRQDEYHRQRASNLRQALYQLKDECELIRRRTRAAVAQGNEWNGLEFRSDPFGTQLTSAKGQVEVLTNYNDVDDLYRVLKRIYRTVEELHKIAGVLAPKSFMETQPREPLPDDIKPPEILVGLLSDLDVALPLLDKALAMANATIS